MNDREEILAKSRKENKDKDLFELEVEGKAGLIGACAAAVLATIFEVIQLFAGGGLNHGLVAIVFSVYSTIYIVKAIRMKRRNDITFAVLHAVLTLVFSFNYIHGLIESATLL